MCAIKLDDIAKLRSVEWSRAYNWDIFFTETSSAASPNKFIGAGSQLLNMAQSFLGTTPSIPLANDGNPSWFPITEFSDTEASVVNTMLEGTYRGYSIPFGTKELTMSITFIDDINATMFKWAREWMQVVALQSVETGRSYSNFQSLGNGVYTEDYEISSSEFEYVKTMSEMTKRVFVSKLDNQMNVLTINNYLVIPEGELIFQGKSEDGLNTYKLNLIKVAVGKEEQGEGAPVRWDIISNKVLGGVRRGTKGLLR